MFVVPPFIDILHSLCVQHCYRYHCHLFYLPILWHSEYFLKYFSCFLHSETVAARDTNNGILRKRSSINTSLLSLFVNIDPGISGLRQDTDNATIGS